MRRARQRVVRPPRRAALGGALVVVLLAAACGGTSGEEAPTGPEATEVADTSTATDGEDRAASGDPGGPSDSEDGDGSSDGEQPTVGLDPAFAVDPPGRLKDLPRTADILVQTRAGIPEETLAEIRDLEGVQDVEQFSMLQVGIENRVLNLAAVDPASFRRFTPGQVPQSREVWDRVAGGELAIAPELQKKLPIDEQGFVELDQGSPQVHLGALAPQIENAVDAVVNVKWGEELGAEPGNALLISTGITAPDKVVKPLTALLPRQTSVQRLDSVARFGLDINAKQTAFVVGSVSEAVGVFNYTVLGGGRIAPAESWVRTHITTAQVPILGSVTCNKAIIPQLTAALREVVETGLADEINPGEYAGCYYPRFIAGSTTLSNHSFGLALDLNTPGNQRGTVGEMDRTVVAIFKKWGFGWGGDWRYTDPMHFEAVRIVDVR
ncbi:MAG: M15 family metallopeptidase [Nocardioides marinisabuli]|uniref:M15 family metallopeptidase n=1 Tax=Nocardioides marinisabuli TaxID=419476 RepID=UPI00321BAC0F